MRVQPWTCPLHWLTRLLIVDVWSIVELAQCSTELLEDNLACRQIEMIAAGILEERHISSSPASQGSSRKVAENNDFFDLNACARLQDITHAIKRRLSSVEKHMASPKLQLRTMRGTKKESSANHPASSMN